MQRLLSCLLFYHQLIFHNNFHQSLTCSFCSKWWLDALEQLTQPITIIQGLVFLTNVLPLSFSHWAKTTQWAALGRLRLRYQSVQQKKSTILIENEGKKRRNGWELRTSMALKSNLKGVGVNLVDKFLCWLKIYSVEHLNCLRGWLRAPHSAAKKFGRISESKQRLFPNLWHCI